MRIILPLSMKEKSSVETIAPCVLEMQPIRTNRYLVKPMVGPNLPTVDYGSVETEKASDFYDYGYVYEEIKGEWVEWFEWDRPTNWYPTNHVNVAVEVPPGVEYDTFMNEFKKTFYDIASTVLYIHNVIDVYTFGADKAWEEAIVRSHDYPNISQY